MEYSKERDENVSCRNNKCQFWKQNSEIQNCEAECHGESAIASCKIYSPEIDAPNCLMCNKKMENEDTHGMIYLKKKEQE
jgi:hypothetical protein